MLDSLCKLENSTFPRLFVQMLIFHPLNAPSYLPEQRNGPWLCMVCFSQWRDYQSLWQNLLEMCFQWVVIEVFIFKEKNKIVTSVRFGKCTRKNSSFAICCWAELVALLLSFLKYNQMNNYHCWWLFLWIFSFRNTQRLSASLSNGKWW